MVQMTVQLQLKRQTQVRAELQRVKGVEGGR